MENGINNTNYNLLPTSSYEDIITLQTTYYYRWSTPGQVKDRSFRNNHVEFDEKKTIEDVVKKCQDAIASYKGFCSRCNREIHLIDSGIGYLDKGTSGRKLEREEIDKLLEDAATGKFQAVVTPYSSRIGRRRSVSATIRDRLKDLGIQMYSLHQPVPLKCTDCFDPLDDDSAVLSETLSDMQSELELSQIRRNYRIGMPARIRKGLPPGSLPFALIKRYKVIGKDAQGNDILSEFYEWDDKKATIVKRIAKSFLSGSGCLGIAHKLNLENIPSPQGTKWSRTTISIILKNPAFAGLIRFGWKTSRAGKRKIQPREKWMLEKASYKSLWNENYYEKIQKEIKKRKSFGNRAFASSSLLIGILKCGQCKHSMFQTATQKLRSNGNLYKYRGYTCSNYTHRGLCVSNGIKQEKLNSLVLREVAKLFNEDARKAYFAKAQKSQKVDLHKLLNEKIRLLTNSNKELQRAKEAYLRDIDTISDYAKNKERYEPIITSLTSEATEIEKKIANTAGALSWNNSYKEAVSRFMTQPTEEDKKKIKYILSQIVETIEFKKKPFSIKINYRVS